jgi:phosphotransferase system HPr-like phosphotransfer protein
MLAATKGTYIKLKSWGKEHHSLAIAIRNLVDNHFGEES